MSWIKRNLFFVLGTVVALALLVGAGFYNFIAWRRNAEAREQLNGAYEKLKALNNKDPNPGAAGGNVDNVERAQAQQRDVLAVLAKTAAHFEPIQPIPPSTKGSSLGVSEFTTALSTTIDRLQREATNASVGLPPGPPYNFSFQAQSAALRFVPSTLRPLSQKLGEVKAICDVLIQAKINSLDNIRRERVPGEDDLRGFPDDYMDRPSRTNELAVLTPYEVTFRCFSSELAAVLSGFASSPHGFLVQGVNVEPAASTGTTEMPGMMAATAPPVMMPPPPGMSAIPAAPPGGGSYLSPSEMDAFRGRGTYNPTPAPAPMPVTPGVAPVVRGGLQTVLDEKALRVTMLIEVVKLLPRR